MNWNKKLSMMSTSALNRFIPALHIEAITEFSGFLALRGIWDQLVEEAGIDYPFLSHDWVRTWWECFGKGKRLHILLIRHGKDPVALIPLMYGYSRMYGFRVRQLEFIHNSHTPRCDFIIARYPLDVYRTVWRYLNDIKALWDVVKLPQLTSESSTLPFLQDIATEDGLSVGCWPSSESPYLTLTGTWDDYLKGLDRKHLSNVRNRLNRMGKLGKVELEVVSTGDEIGHSLETGFDIEAKAWKGRAGTAILRHPDLLVFYQKIARRAAERGWLQLNFLSVNGRRIAFDFSLLYKNKVYVLKPGYDPEFAALSPYNTLCYLKLRDAFEKGLSEYDFLGMKDDWKLNWTGATRSHYWLFLFSTTLRTALLHYAKFRLSPELNKFRPYRMLRDIGSRLLSSDHA